MSRRADGELEQLVLAVLWDGDGPMSPAQVRAELGSGLAYTSIATILTRLLAKGHVRRSARGRSFVYVAAVTRDEWNSARMADALGRSEDRSAALAHFVGRLGKKEIAALKKALEELGP